MEIDVSTKQDQYHAEQHELKNSNFVLSTKQTEIFKAGYDYYSPNNAENKNTKTEKLNEGEDEISSLKIENAVLNVNFPVVNDSLANQLIFNLPNWGVEDYINERNRWIKGISSIGDEPGWFYFKVFFKFNTNFGLFGGVLDSHKLMQSTCALRYLNTIKTLYKVEQIPMRINALLKFTSILSQINTKYPWMIKGISGLDKVMSPQIDNFHEEKTFDLVFNYETTDMKLINMLNYYKYACYDDINEKEIIPENLRKFDMMVVFYHVPIKYFQTAIMTAPKQDIRTGLMKPGTKLAKAEDIINKSYNFLTSKSTYFKYKRMHPDNGDFSNMMSFNMFTFQNCEFDADSFGQYYEGAEIKNENAFQFAETAIKIKYEKVYFHTMNEWSQTLFGSDGFYYDKNFPEHSGLNENTEMSIRGANDNFKERLNSIKIAKRGASFFDKNAEQYKSLIDFSESVITDGLMNMSMKNYYAFIKGNLYGGNVGVGSDYFNEKISFGSVKGNLYGKTGVKSGYYNEKLLRLTDGGVSGNLFGNTIIRDANSKWKESYFTRKLKALKEGTISYSKESNILAYKPNKMELENERLDLKPTLNFKPIPTINNDIFEPILVFDEKKRQKMNIANYISANFGYSKLTGNSNGIFGDFKNTINDTMSFWKMSKNDW